MKTKFVDKQYPKSTAGYTLICSKAVSCTQGKVAFEVKLVLFNNGPNILTFQLVMGDGQFYVLGAYIPPNCTREVKDLRLIV